MDSRPQRPASRAESTSDIAADMEDDAFWTEWHEEMNASTEMTNGEGS